MMKIGKLIGDVELTKDLKILLVTGGLYSLSVALSNTFVNVFLWKQSGEFRDLGLYNLAIILLQLFTFTLAGRWAKKIDRVIVFRIGVAFSYHILFNSITDRRQSINVSVSTRSHSWNWQRILLVSL